MGSDSSYSIGRRDHPRAAPRAPVQVHFSAGRIDGTGVLEDLSMSGGRIASASACPAPGARVELVLILSGTERVRAPAEVVRSTAKGFAVRFQRVAAELRDFVPAALPPEDG